MGATAHSTVQNTVHDTGIVLWHSFVSLQSYLFGKKIHWNIVLLRWNMQVYKQILPSSKDIRNNNKAPKQSIFKHMSEEVDVFWICGFGHPIHRSEHLRWELEGVGDEGGVRPRVLWSS